MKEVQEMPVSKAHQKWVAENTTRIVMNLNHNTDADLLEKLESVPSKQGYIKQLIRQDITKCEVSTSGMTKRQARAFTAMQALSAKNE